LEIVSHNGLDTEVYELRPAADYIYILLLLQYYYYYYKFTVIIITVIMMPPHSLRGSIGLTSILIFCRISPNNIISSSVGRVVIIPTNFVEIRSIFVQNERNSDVG